jgi:hypothetical protein
VGESGTGTVAGVAACQVGKPSGVSVSGRTTVLALPPASGINAAVGAPSYGDGYL